MGDGPPGFRRNSTCSAVLRIHSGGNSFSTTGLLPSVADLSRSIHLKNSLVTPSGVSYNPRKQAFWFGLFPFRSPLLRKSIFLSLPPGTEMFQFPGSTSCTLCIQMHVLFQYEQWVPHSEIPGSKFTYNSPRHIGVSPVLHRLLVPRHPPCALIHLTKLQ